MLTNTAIEALKPGPKSYKKADRDGLFLLVTPAGVRTPKGGKLWRMKFQYEGRAQQLAFGSWPEVSLAEARDKCRAARDQLRNKINPAKRASTIDASTSARPTFEQLAREWHAKQTPSWGERHARDVIGSLVKDVFPALGAMPL